ncbi:MAG: hypothetical protein O4859_28025 [Trichodesmium sp. St18_bin1]|nr:hypothetical protein [Trichodesmium sp. St18_bin1]
MITVSTIKLTSQPVRFLTHKYLPETGFAEFAWVSPENLNWSDTDIAIGANQLKYCLQNLRISWPKWVGL